MVPDPEKFPNGIKYLADYFHERLVKDHSCIIIIIIIIAFPIVSLMMTQEPPIGNLQQRGKIHLLGELAGVARP